MGSRPPRDRFDDEDRAVKWINCVAWSALILFVVALLIALLNLLERFFAAKF